MVVQGSGSKGPVLIAGGGIGGLTAALCLARAGFAVAVFEQAAEFGELGGGIQISPNGSRVLHHLGLARELEAIASRPAGIEFRSWRSGKVISAAPLGEACVAAYGFPYCHVHRGDLLRMLVEAARREGGAIALHANAKVTGFGQTGDGVQVAVAGGAGEAVTRQGVSLVGADGIHSQVREALFGPLAARFTGNVAWRAVVPATRLPKGWVRPVGAVWWGPGRHFVHYPVRGGALVNCVAVVEKAGWEVESWTERGRHGELKAEFAGWHKEIQVLIDGMAPGALYKWALHDRAPMPRWGKGAVTLLGDACHPMLPFMAQGAVSAIEDAAVLATCLAGSAPSAGLKRYEGLRRRRTALMQRQARRNARLFHLAGLPAWLRDRTAKLASGRIMDKLYRYDAVTAAAGRAA